MVRPGAVFLVIGAAVAGTACLAEAPAVVWDAEPGPTAGTKAPVELDDGTVVTAGTVPAEDGKALACFRSRDGGRTWEQAGLLTGAVAWDTDLGDQDFVPLADGTLLCSYRENYHHGLPPEERRFAIKVASSADGGRTWEPHSVVMACSGTPRGLWASFLLQKRDGAVQCYYDDEYSTAREGFDGHQWAWMKTWDPARREWIDPTVVSRAHDPALLSRDGMCSVVELSSGRLVCAVESVRTTAPFKGNIRCVTSDDGGRTWSWKAEERQVLYEPADEQYNALAPWLIRMSTGGLLCVFVTDEDRAAPDTPATGKLDESVKWVVSADDGRTWPRTAETLDGNHPLYLPGVCELRRGADAGTLLCQYVHYTEHTGLMKRGRVPLPQCGPVQP